MPIISCSPLSPHTSTSTLVFKLQIEGFIKYQFHLFPIWIDERISYLFHAKRWSYKHNRCPSANLQSGTNH